MGRRNSTSNRGPHAVPSRFTGALAMNRIRVSAAALVLAGGLTVTAQTPRLLQPEEYGKWESIATQRVPLSPDGNWLVYGLNRSSRQNEMRFQPTAGGNPITVAFGEQPAFSDDGKWAACLVGISEEDEAKLQKDRSEERRVGK